jgi:hypothetical protein
MKGHQCEYSRLPPPPPSCWPRRAVRAVNRAHRTLPPQPPRRQVLPRRRLPRPAGPHAPARRPPLRPGHQCHRHQLLQRHHRTPISAAPAKARNTARPFLRLRLQRHHPILISAAPAKARNTVPPAPSLRRQRPRNRTPISGGHVRARSTARSASAPGRPCAVQIDPPHVPNSGSVCPGIRCNTACFEYRTGTVPDIARGRWRRRGYNKASRVVDYSRRQPRVLRG